MADVFVPPPLPVRFPDMTLGDRGQWIMRDVHHVPSLDRGRVKEYLHDAWSRLPPEIQCRTQGTLEESVELVKRREGAEAVENFLAREAQRLAEQDMLGLHIRPIRFAMLDRDEKVVGGFEFYGIKLLTMTARLIEVSGMPFPAFAHMGLDMAAQMKLCADVCEITIASPGIQIGPTLFRATQVRTYTYVDPRQVAAGHPGHEETAAWNLEADRRSASLGSLVRVQKTTNEWGREERIVTRASS